MEKKMEEISIEDFFKDASPFDQYTDEEMLYWSTPYFDYLQEQKELKKQRIQDEVLDG